jgi:IS5 family transposase
MIFDMKSRVHPKYKTRYHVGNWPEYDRALVQRGDVTLWLAADAIDAWKPEASGRPGGQRRFSDAAIETALTLRLVFRLPLRQTEGFVRSILALMQSDLDAPDHTTLSRRAQQLDVELDRVPAERPIHLVVDSTGLSIFGEGEWAAVRHGGRGQRGWRKLHLGVDAAGMIVARALTDSTVDDATIGAALIGAVDQDIARVTGDAAYDTVAFYAAAGGRRASVVVPPHRTARVSRRRPRSSARDRTIRRVQALGRRRWKKASGYHRQARVENAFFRYKRIVGDGLRARSDHSRQVETCLACNVLNRMTELGRPESFVINR